jgi:hypothetical protein
VSGDRELLEAAAKAVGIELSWEGGLTPYRTDNADDWNPLTDDGDALRLAVTLRLPEINIVRSPDGSEDGHTSATWMHTPTARAGTIQHFDGDPYAATRRAIVRAAAAIGEAL